MAKKGAMRRDPKYTIQPVRDGNGRTAGDSDVLGNTKGARRAAEQLARKTPTERLSPGVYRSASGDLVGQGGRPIQRQPQAPMAQPTQQVMPQGQPPMEDQFFQPSPGDVGQQVNKPFPMDGLGNFNPGSIGKTPPGWPGGQVTDMMMRYPTLQGMPQMPQMPQPSVNQGGQYRLSPGMYGSREQAMQQYNQQMQPYMMQGVPQQRKG